MTFYYKNLSLITPEVWICKRRLFFILTTACVAAVTSGGVLEANAASYHETSKLALPITSKEHPAKQNSVQSAKHSRRKSVANQNAENLQVTGVSLTGRFRRSAQSVVAYTAKTLQDAGVRSIADLQVLTPSLNFAQEGAWSKPHLRGIGTTATGPGVESSVGLYIDDIYYASTVGSATDFNNIASVVVLNGPQGTEGGRSETGGAIRINTKDPQHKFSGSANVGYGNYATTQGNLYVTGEVSKKLAADLAIRFSDQENGYGKNYYTKKEIDKTQSFFVRSKWLYEPQDGVKIRFIADYGHMLYSPILQPAPGTTPLGGNTNVKPHDLNGPYNPSGILNTGGFAVKSEINLGGVLLETISGIRLMYSRTNEDGALTNIPDLAENISLRENHRQITQELRVSGQHSLFTWRGGLFYMHEDAWYAPTELSGDLYAPYTQIDYYTHTRTNTGGIYGNMSFAIDPDTRVVAEVRYDVEGRSISISNLNYASDGSSLGVYSSSGSKTYHGPSAKVALEHTFNRNLFGYVSYNHGFKSGGWNPSMLPVNAYNPEIVDSFEIGTKFSAFNKRLNIDLSGFYYLYKNIQVQSYETGILDIMNGASANVKGIDLNGRYQILKHLTGTFGVELLDSRFTSYPKADITSAMPCGAVVAGVCGGTYYGQGSAKGNHMPYSSPVTATVSLTYVQPTHVGDFSFTGAYQYNGGFYGEPDNRLHQKSYSLLNANIGWTSPSNRYIASLWMKNLTNSVYSSSLFSQSNGDVIMYAPPRTYGFTVGVNF